MVHRTVVPALIVSELGEKVKSWMVTSMVPLAGGFDACPPLLGVMGPEEPPHATAAAVTAIPISRKRYMVLLETSGWIEVRSEPVDQPMRVDEP